jgi:tight adherence protein B
MLNVLLIIGVFLLVVAGYLLTQNRSKGDKATLARIDSILSGGEAVSNDDPILLELDRRSLVEKILGRTSIVQHVDTTLDQAAWTISADVFLLWSVGAGFGGFVLSWLFWPGLPFEFATFAGFACLPYFVLRARRTKRLRAFDKVLPDAIDMVQRMLRAGVARQAAFERAAEQAKEPVRSEFKVVVNRMQRGADERLELMKLADRVPTADLRIFVTALLVQRETGGDLPAVLERLTDMIRIRVRMLGEMKAKTAQGRMSGIFLSLTPLFMAAIMKILNPSYLDPLFYDPRGRYMLIYCVISDVVGVFFIRRITTMEV